MKTKILAHSDLPVKNGTGRNSENLGTMSKKRFFHPCSYFAIFSLIFRRFEARNVSNDRESFSLQNRLFQ